MNSFCLQAIQNFVIENVKSILVQSSSIKGLTLMLAAGVKAKRSKRPVRRLRRAKLARQRRHPHQGGAVGGTERQWGFRVAWKTLGVWYVKCRMLIFYVWMKLFGR